MSTSAAVYIEALERSVRVNSDGYPSHMIPALKRLVDEGLLEELVSRDEYSFLVPNDETFEEYRKEYEDRYVAVEHVGYSFPDDDSSPITTIGYNGHYSFEDGENYEYVIKSDGEVILWKGEAK